MEVVTKLEETIAKIEKTGMLNSFLGTVETFVHLVKPELLVCHLSRHLP